MTATAERDLVFFSYRHEDARWLAAIRGAVEPYVVTERLIGWSDHDIRTGARWEHEILQAIARTRVAVVLVSQTFFGSEYITRYELPRLVADAEAGLLTLVCVPVGRCDSRLYEIHRLSRLQFSLDPEQPLGARRGDRRERALVEVAKKIDEAFGQSASIPAAPPVTPRRGVVVAGPGPRLAEAAGELLDVPPLDSLRHVARTEEMETIRKELLFGTEIAQGVSSSAREYGLHGMGGMGKTVLAQALCHDAEVRAAFPDGIAWVVLGQRPDLLAAQSRLLALLDPEGPPPVTVDDARERLRKHLASRRVLLVIDDLWDAGHYRRAFDVAQGRSRILITTRDSSLLTAIAARAHPLRALPLPLGLELLGRWSGKRVAELPREAKAIAELCRGLPLAVALAGAQIADGLAWNTLEEQLRQGRIDFLDHPYGSIYQSLGRSVDALAPEDRDRYLELAVFPEDVAIDLTVVARLWMHTGGLDAAAVEQLLVRLDRKALLTLSRVGPPVVQLHDLQQDFLRLRCEDEEVLHRRLLEAYRASYALPPGPSGWARMPAREPYLWRWLSYHLSAAGRVEELEAALVDLEFIRARLGAETSRSAGNVFCSVGALRADYERTPTSSPARPVGQCLRKSAHVLGRHPEALEQQLFGRLGAAQSGVARSLATAAHAAMEARDTLVPVLASLHSPSTQAVTLAGHSEYVYGALLLPDGHRALSWSVDGTLRLWDLDGEGEPRVFTGHEAVVDGALLLPEGRRALSWSTDGTLRLWDLDGEGAPRVFTGHASTVEGALLLPDGRRALSWSADSTLRLWDLDGVGEPRVFTGHEAKVDGALLLPDGRRALSWSTDRTLRLWDLDGEAEPRVLAGHEGSVRGALLLPDGRRALSWSDDSTLRLWDLDGEGAPMVLTGHEDWVLGALLLDGRRALSWSIDSTVRLWDLDGDGEPRVLTRHADIVHGVLLLPDGQRALSWCADDTLRLWDLDGQNEPRVFTDHEASVHGALLLPDGRRALSWSADRTLRLWSLDGESEPRVLRGHFWPVDGALLLPDGRRALSWSVDGTLKLWDLEGDGEQRVLTGHEDSVDGALLLPDGRRALSWSSDRTLRLWDLDKEGEPRVLTGHEGSVRGALLLPDGHRALSWSADSTLRLWDLDAEGKQRVFTGHEDIVDGALLLPDGHHALSWSFDKTLRLWDLDGQGEPRVFTGHEASVGGALLLPDGHGALSWSADKTLRLWGIDGQGSPRVFTGHEASVDGALLLPDNHRALSWSYDASLRLWDLDGRGEPRVLTGHEDWVGGALLLRDGRHALSWSADQTLRLWNLDGGGDPRVLTGHEDWVAGALFLPDGHGALSWSADKTLRLWSLDGGGEPRVFTGHEARVSGALLLPDGRRALSWSADRTLRLWDLNSFSQRACYYADAIISAVQVESTGRRAFIGDALGAVQVLQIAAGDA